MFSPGWPHRALFAVWALLLVQSCLPWGWSSSLFEPGPPKTSIQQAGWGHIHPIAGQAYLPFSVFLPSLPGGTSAHQASESILGAGEGTPPLHGHPPAASTTLNVEMDAAATRFGKSFPLCSAGLLQKKKKKTDVSVLMPQAWACNNSLSCSVSGLCQITPSLWTLKMLVKLDGPLWTGETLRPEVCL